MKQPLAKVCMMVSNEVVSDPRVTKEARTLSQQYELIVVGLSKENRQSRIVDEYTIHWARERFGMKLGKVGKAFNRLIGCCRMTRIGFKINAEVYHAHDFDMLPFAFLLAKIKRGKLVYDSHELWAEQRADFPKWFKFLVMKLEKLLIRRTNAVITVNESIAVELQSRNDLAVKPVIIHNFSERVELHSQDRNTSERINVLYHGGYMSDRGLEELVQSSIHLERGIIIQMRGVGPLEDTIRQRISTQQLSSVEILPPVSMKELIQAAQHSDIGIIPYKPTCLNNYYSLPNKLSEYAMAGLAICASDLPEIRKLNERYQFGELFDPNNPESISTAINKLAADPEYLERCKRNARAWADSMGNWEAEQPKLRILYRKLLGEEDE